MSDKKTGPSLEELGRSIDEAKARNHIEKKTQNRGTSSSYSLGVRVGVELVAGVIVGVVIGYQLDKWLDTRPIFFFIFLLVGVIAGFVNMYRAVMNEDNSNESVE